MTFDGSPQDDPHWTLAEVTAHHRTRALHTVVADLVLWRYGTPYGAGLEVLLIQRQHEPFAGRWALPGGFVEAGETTRDAAAREGLEEVGVIAESLELVGVFDAPGRDPRGPNIGVAYKSRWHPRCGVPKGGDDAINPTWFPLVTLPEMAFDHAEIIDKALWETGS